MILKLDMMNLLIHKFSDSNMKLDQFRIGLEIGVYNQDVEHAFLKIYQLSGNGTTQTTPKQ